MKINWFKIDKDYLSHELHYVLIGANELSGLVRLITQGFRCKDCEFEYFECSCSDFSNYDLLSYHEINIFVVNFFIKNLSKKNINQFLDRYKYDDDNCDGVILLKEEFNKYEN